MRLGDLTQQMKNQSARLTAGRFLQALAAGRGDFSQAEAWAAAQHQWVDRHAIVPAIRQAAVTTTGTTDFPAGALQPVAESFLAAMRAFSVPLQLLPFLRRVPMFTRLYINASGMIGAQQVPEGGAVPVLRGNWTAVTLLPKKFAGIVVETDELAKSTSPVATLAFVNDLAEAVAAAENRAFVSPYEAGSVLAGAPTFVGSGSSPSQIDTDLKRLVGLVPGAFRPGAAFVMTADTATFLGTVRGSGGAACYPDIGPQGGRLLGVQALTTDAAEEVGSPPTRIIGLVSPSEIFWADDGRVFLSTSNQAALKQEDAPTAAAGNLVALFQTNATALKAIRESAWHARAGSGAYFVAGF